MTHVWYHQSEASEQQRFGASSGTTVPRQKKDESNLAYVRRLLEGGRHDWLTAATSFVQNLKPKQQQKLLANFSKQQDLMSLVTSGAQSNEPGSRELLALLQQGQAAGGFGNLPRPGQVPGAGGSGGNFGFGAVDKGNWRSILGGIGRQFPFDVQPFIDKAIRNASTTEEAGLLAREYILGSSKFKKAYPGIFRPDGTIKMEVGQYLELTEGYRSTAASYGFALTKEQMGALVNGDVSPAEFETRAKAVQIVQRNPDAFAALQRQVDEYNASVPQDRRIKFNITNPQSVVNFATGAGDRETYDLFEAAQFEAAAARQGITITGKRARELARRTPGLAEFGEIQEGYGAIGSLLRDYDAELRSFGVEQRGLEEQVFGRGTGARGYAIEQAQKQRQARLQGGQGTGRVVELFSAPGA